MPERGAEAVTTQMGRLGAEDPSTTPQQVAYLPVFEIVGVDLDEIAPLLRDLVLGKDRVDGPRVDSRPTADAPVSAQAVHPPRPPPPVPIHAPHPHPPSPL